MGFPSHMAGGDQARLGHCGRGRRRRCEAGVATRARHERQAGNSAMIFLGRGVIYGLSMDDLWMIYGLSMISDSVICTIYRVMYYL